MNKQEAITILAGLYRIPVENGADEFAQEINKAIDMAIEALQDDWIPVSEPPKENGVCNISLEDSVYPWGGFFNGKWFMLSADGTAREFSEYEVTAWQPLPAPYKESEE